MATAMKAASSREISISTSMYIKTALFHSSPVLERKRRTHWDYGGGSNKDAKKNHNHSKRFRKMYSKDTLLRNVSAYAEELFKSWRDADYDDYEDPSPSKGSSWFKRQCRTNGTRQNDTHSQGPRWETYRDRGGFRFSYLNDEDDEVERIFRSALGGTRFTYWSFIDDEEDSSSWSSWKYSNNRKSSKNWRYRRDYDYDSTDEDNNNSAANLAADRTALGLSAAGPLNLDDVKSAYRACALKWHPDRHQGSSKAAAEEKFKHCSAAYQSLCDKLE